MSLGYLLVAEMFRNVKLGTFITINYEASDLKFHLSKDCLLPNDFWKIITV